jgi:hypothetical protein
VLHAQFQQRRAKHNLILVEIVQVFKVEQCPIVIRDTSEKWRRPVFFVILSAGGSFVEERSDEVPFDAVTV